MELYWQSATSPKASSPIQVGTKGLSSPFSPDQTNFSLAVKTPGNPPALRTVAQIEAQQIEAQDADDYILPLVPRKNGLQPILITDNSPDFGPGSVLFLNSTESDLVVRIGDQTIEIPSKIHTFAKRPADEEASWQQVQISEVRKDGTSKLISNSRWPNNPSLRTILFFSRNPQNQRIHFQIVDLY